MKLAIFVGTALVMFPALAQATPTTVKLRVEGSTGTIFEGPVVTDGKTISKGGVAAPCGNDNPASPVATMTTALDDGSLVAGFDWDADYFGDFYVNRIGPDASDFVGNRYWGIARNFIPTSVGGCQEQVAAGDEVLFAYDFFQPDFTNKHLLKLEGPAVAQVGQPIDLQVSEIACTDPVCSATTVDPAVGATVAGRTVAGDGTVTISSSSATTLGLKAEKPGTIRSNVLDVCVHVSGDGKCKDVPILVKDLSAPRATISGIKSGKRFRRRGPRLLSGTATDSGSGVAAVKLSLRRHAGGRCSWWSATAERFSGKGCGRKVFFGIGNKRDWSYQLAKALGPGHYVLDVKVRDRAGNLDDAFVRGRNRVVFDVGRPAPVRAQSSKSSGPKVEVMIVGKQGKLLSAPRTVKAKSATVKASGRRCLVGASTPLAALVPASKALSLSVKDFGSCSRDNAADAAQLFVNSIGGNRNRGADGWVYKLRNKIPSLGGGDPLARVRQNDRLVWLYCVHDKAGHCPPTLQVAAPARAPAGGQVEVFASKVDDAGRKTPAPGARLRMGKQVAVTGAGGSAIMVVPTTPGKVAVEATANDAIASFPRTISVSAGTL